MKKLHIHKVLALLSLLVGGANVASAQSSIWLVPTTDTAQPGTKYAEADLIPSPRSYADGGYAVFGTRTTFGFKHNIEAGANLFVTRSGASTNIELQPHIKFQFYNNKKTGVAAAAGTLVYVPTVNRSVNDTFAMGYAVISKRFAGDYGPRFTTGVYGLSGRQSGTGSKAGFVFGYEQPLSKKVLLGIDHMTGTQVHGGHSATNAGLIVTLSPKVVFGTGYTWGNVLKGNNGAFLFVGYSF